MFLAGLESKEAVLSFAIVMFWIFNLMENVFFRYLVENPNPFRDPFDPHHEGEKIGFLYTFLNSNEPLKDIFFEPFQLEISSLEILPGKFNFFAAAVLRNIRVALLFC